MTPARPRSAIVPTALRPRSEKPAVPPEAEQPRQPERIPLHIAIAIPDERLLPFIRDHVYILGPTTMPSLSVTAHVVLVDKNHVAAALHPFMRWALVETGLVTPENVGLVTRAQTELGWAGHEAREQDRSKP